MSVNTRNWLVLLIASLSVFWGQIFNAAGMEPTPKIIVVYGDSITAGGAQLTAAERSRLWLKQVEANSKGALRMVNEGKGGRPTHSLAEFEAMLKRHPATDLLIIALGGNDARDTSGSCAPNAVKNLKTMLTRARETYGPTLRILLVGPANIRKDALGPTKPIADLREANLIALNHAYAELAKKEACAFLSLYGVLPQATLALDGVHPDGAGHDEIAKAMLPAVARAFANDWSRR